MLTSDIPAELCHEILLHCDQYSLVNVCLVDHLWGSEAQRVLYASIRISEPDILSNRRPSTASVTSRPSILHTLSKSPSKAALVRTMLIDLYEGSPAWDITRLVSPLSRALMSMPNLIDLRLFANWPRDMVLGKEVLRVLGSADECPFRLRALHVPGGARHLSSVMRSVLAVHSPSLDVLGFYDDELMYDFSWVAGMVLGECALFKVDGPWLLRPRELMLNMRLHSSVERTVDKVAGSLDADPAGRTSADVTDLLLELRAPPSPYLAQIIGARFPKASALQLILPHAQLEAHLDPSMVAQVAQNLPAVWTLWIVADDEQPTRDVTVAERLAVVRALVAHRCETLSSIVFPDGSNIGRHSEAMPGLWLGTGGTYEA